MDHPRRRILPRNTWGNRVTCQRKLKLIAGFDYSKQYPKDKTSEETEKQAMNKMAQDGPQLLNN